MAIDRLIQILAAVLLTVCVSTAGFLLPGILRSAEDAKLRYTDVAVDGAPPIVALATAVGAIRGIVVDYLWIRVQMMKEKGLYYEIKADADLITKLQPRFAQVWAFHGHNMAYNISVCTNTPEERWAWVRQGIDLVRNQGLRYNPNDLELSKELAFWFAHKIEGTSDDAHLYYKREFGREWHLLLGAPPYDWDERIAWIKKVADAPETLEEAEARTPGVKALVERLQSELTGIQRRLNFSMNGRLLQAYGLAESVSTSPYAGILGLHEKFKASSADYNVFYNVIHDPSLNEARDTFLAFLRKKVLKEEYNMDPQFMYELTRDVGPIDWRHGQAHALYWAAWGGKHGESRFKYDDGTFIQDDIYKVVNNDRYFIQAMQALANNGNVMIDPFSDSYSPTRLPENRWIKVINKYFRQLYIKHHPTRGAGGDGFIDFYENFMSGAIRKLYRAGDLDGAQEILTELDGLFGRGGVVPNTKYVGPLDVFVRETTYGEYDNVPEVAITDLQQALRRGYLEGILYGDGKVLREALQFASDVRVYFQGAKFWNFKTKFGTGRVRDLISNLQLVVESTFVGTMLDTSIPLPDRLTLYRKASEDFQRMAYDAVKGPLRAELESSVLSEKLRFEQVFPEPPGMAGYREAFAMRREKESRDLENLLNTEMEQK